MPGRGMYLALSDKEDELFHHLRTPGARKAFFAVVSEYARGRWAVHVDKVWDPIHRCLTDGQLHYGRSPLYRCVLGNKNYFGQNDARFLGYVKPEDVRRVIDALAGVDQAFFLRNYEKIDQADYAWEKGEEDFDFVWDFFKRVRRFYRRAADDERAVLFECYLY
jgi:hypothetical protein